jgi:hypothetical protein
MHYKTMVLELLQQHPEIHDRLRSRRELRPALDRYAGELKTRHDAWKEVLSRANPGSSESQVASEALEIALKELAYHFDCGPTPDPDNPLSLEEAMAFLRRHSPPE